MRKIIQYILKIISRLVIKKYKPRIIGITGSVGKTTTKEAIFSVLSKKYRVGKSIKNYNNEIGLPLSILGFESPGKNIFSWLALFGAGLMMIIKTDKFYPEILVLEMGIDRPGDMDYLNSIVKCDMGVVTNIGISHIEYFGTTQKIKKEKAKLIENLKKKGLAIINFDNPKSREIIKDSREKVLTFGLNEGADVRADEIKFRFDYQNAGFSGMNFKLRYMGSVVPVFINSSVGFHLIYASLIATIVARELGMNLLEVSEALKDFKSPRGRLNLLEGINHSIIIDDTYNASPQSTIQALEILSEMKTSEARKIVVLGDMLELGDEKIDEHTKIGRLVVKSGADMLLCYGDLAENICAGAIKAKMNKKNVLGFKTQKELFLSLKNELRKNDIILVKGSQGARMEKIVKALLANKESAEKLLVRQDGSWLK